MADQSIPTEKVNKPIVGGGIWRHYKGGYYLVLGVAEHSETKERLVVYVALTGIQRRGPRMRARPSAMWFDQVQVDGKPVWRFEFLSADELSEEQRETAAQWMGTEWEPNSEAAARWMLERGNEL